MSLDKALEQRVRQTLAEERMNDMPKLLQELDSTMQKEVYDFATDWFLEHKRYSEAVFCASYIGNEKLYQLLADPLVYRGAASIISENERMLCDHRTPLMLMNSPGMMMYKILEAYDLRKEK